MYKMVGDICKPHYQEESILSKTLKGFYSFSVKMKIKVSPYLPNLLPIWLRIEVSRLPVFTPIFNKLSLITYIIKEETANI